MNNILKFVLCILTPLIIGGVSGIATAANIPTWYASLQKPSFNPPNYLFGPVWTVLYILMGLSLYMVLQKATAAQTKSILLIFAVQLTLNFFWSILFFAAKQLGLALVEIIFMWSAILGMIIIYYPINKAAALLQIPYLLWVSFATLLNASIWKLN